MAQIPCPACGGAATGDYHSCYNCQGTGRVDDGSSSSSNSSGGGGGINPIVVIIDIIKFLWKIKIVYPIFAALVLIIALSLYFGQQYPRPETVSAHFELRETADFKAKSLVAINAGATINLTGRSVNDWFPAEYEDKNGWIYYKYVQPQDRAIVTANSTVLRKEPNNSSEVLATLVKGTVVICDEKSRLRVLYNGIWGFISAEDVTFKTWREK